MTLRMTEAESKPIYFFIFTPRIKICLLIQDHRSYTHFNIRIYLFDERNISPLMRVSF